MYALQPKHSKLKEEEIKTLLEKFNISLGQMPKIKKSDPALPEGVQEGDIIKIERKGEKDTTYYRVVVSD